MNEWHIEHIEECQSTNGLMKDRKKNEGLGDKTAIVTEFQSLGKGRGENHWHSEASKNLLLSLYTETKLKVERHFLLTIITSLSVFETLQRYSITPTIKWPNDIYVGTHKIAGILIENGILLDTISHSIIGIGLNVNQIKFPKFLPNPVSMKNLTENDFNLKELMAVLLECFESKLSQCWRTKDIEELYHTYTSHLYQQKKWCLYRYNSETFTGNIRGVLPSGEIIIETEGGQLIHPQFGELQYLS